jgi:hypothetical protein
MGKLLLILFAFGALADGMASSQSEPPLLIDESQPASAALDAVN